jgi:hypothetical protein
MRIILTMTRAFWQYPICLGPLDQSGSGSGHATTRAWAMLQLVIRDLQYVLKYIVIDEHTNNFSVFIAFFSILVALAQNMHCGVKECFEGHTHPQQPQKLYPLAWGVVAHPFNALAWSARPHVGH